MNRLSNSFLFLLFLVLGSCSTDDPWSEFQQQKGGYGPGGGMMPDGPDGQGGGMSEALIDLDVLNSFSVDFDHTPLSESEQIPTDKASRVIRM